MLSIDPFIHRRLVILNDDTPAQVVAKAMRHNEIGCVLVTDGQGHLSGIVTDRDFACRWAADYAKVNVPISQIMTPEILEADENSSLNDIISLMETHGVRRIPIVRREAHGEKERIIGIVTLDDLIASGTIAPHHLAQIVRRQIGRRIELSPKFPKTAKSGRRSEAHVHQTLDRFYAYLTQVTGLSSEIVPQITSFLLGSLTMRVSATAAAHFIAQLPKPIQHSLLRLPPGPDRNTTVEWMIAELVSHYRFTEEFARSVFIQFLAGLQNLVDPGAIGNLKAQLPKEFRVLFPEEERVDSIESTPIESVKTVMDLTSPGFHEGDEIPRQYTGEGLDRSPPLRWSNVPVGTKEFALICENPDPAFETSWVHWVIFGIPATVSSLPEGIQKTPDVELPIRARQGKNGWGNIGYQGPMPPVGHAFHRYFFRIYALDREIPLSSGITRPQLAHEMRGHILAEATLTGRYQLSAAREAA